MKNILILTSTITPPTEVLDLKRKNPKDRLEDYKKALKFYLEQITKRNSSIDRIIYVDNSDTDLAPLKEIAKEYKKEDYIEFISFYGLDYPAYRGRGYGEFKLMDYAINKSKVIKTYENGYETIRYWKISGRYIVKNIIQVINRAPKYFSLFMNVKYYSLIKKFKFIPALSPANWIDIYLYAFTLKGYNKYLCQLYKKLGEKQYKTICAEYQIFDFLKDKMLIDSQVFCRFNILPEVYCIKGRTNQKTKRNRWHNFIYSKVRNVLEIFKIWV